MYKTRTHFFPTDMSPYNKPVPNIKALAINVLGPKHKNNGTNDALKKS